MQATSATSLTQALGEGIAKAEGQGIAKAKLIGPVQALVEVPAKTDARQAA